MCICTYLNLHLTSQSNFGQEKAHNAMFYLLHLLMMTNRNQHCCTIQHGCCTMNRVKRNQSTISINEGMKGINAIKFYLLHHLSTCNLHYRILHLLRHIQQQFHKQQWHMLHKSDYLHRTESDGSKKGDRKRCLLKHHS